MTDAVLAQSLQVEAFLEEGVRTGRELLEAAAKAAAERGIAAETRLEDGAPVEAILHLARELAPDLIVMGTHGRRGLTRLVLGSTTESVLHRSAVPVLVVPTVHEAPPAAKGELRAQTVRA
jgi:nucleotide-binding universal stress UspA family protein